MDNIKRFEVGKTYATRSICNQDCVIAVRIIRRTASTVTVDMLRSAINGEQTKTLRINQGEAAQFGEECIRPWGKYSMCPVVRASRAA